MSVRYNPGIVTDGLVNVFDIGNPKCYSRNTFRYGQDIYGWVAPIANDTQAEQAYEELTGTTLVTGCTLSRDFTSSKSPANGIPMKMVVTGADPNTAIYNWAAANITAAQAGQTWKVSVYAKASTNLSDCEIYIFGANSSGAAYVSGWLDITSTNIAVTTEWKRFDHYITLTNASVAYLQVRLDGPNSAPLGAVVWWDGLQVELTSVSTFNPTYNQNNVTIYGLLPSSAPSTVTGTMTNSPTYSNGYLTYNGTSQYVNLPAILPAGRTTYTLSAWWYTTKNTGAQVVYEQNTSTVTAHRRSAILLNGANWGLNGESNDAHDKVPVRPNQWVNGVITVDTAAATNPIKIYENGVLYWQGNTNNNASNLNIGDSASAIGRKVSTGSEYFQGNISNVSVYNKVLSASEVLQNFNALRGRHGI